MPITPVAIFPIIGKTENLRSTPISGTGIKKSEVPRKNAIKKYMLPDRLPFSTAPVKARRKGGQKLKPVANPMSAGRKTGRTFIIFLKEPIRGPAEQDGLILKKP